MTAGGGGTDSAAAMSSVSPTAAAAAAAEASSAPPPLPVSSVSPRQSVSSVLSARGAGSGEHSHSFSPQFAVPPAPWAMAASSGGAIGGNTSSPSQSSAGEPRAALERSTSSSSSSSGAGPKKTRGEVPKDCQIEDFSNYSMDHVNLRRLSYTSLRKFCAQYRMDGGTEHGINLNDNRSRVSMLEWAEEEQIRRTGRAPGRVDPYQRALPPPIDPSIPEPKPPVQSSSSSASRIPSDSPHSSPIPGHSPMMMDIVQQLATASVYPPLAATSRHPSLGRSRHNSISSGVSGSAIAPPPARTRSPTRPASSMSVAARLGLHSPTPTPTPLPDPSAAAAAAVFMQQHMNQQLAAAHASAMLAQRSQTPVVHPQSIPGRANLEHPVGGLGALMSAARVAHVPESVSGPTPMEIALSRSPLPDPRPRSPLASSNELSASPAFRRASIASSVARAGLVSVDSSRVETGASDHRFKQSAPSRDRSNTAHTSQPTTTTASSSSSSSRSKPKSRPHAAKRPPPLEGADADDKGVGVSSSTRRRRQSFGASQQQQRRQSEGNEDADAAARGEVADFSSFERRHATATDRSCKVDSLTSIGSVVIVGHVEDGKNINNNARFTDCWSNANAPGAIGSGGGGGGGANGGGGGDAEVVVGGTPSAFGAAMPSSSSSALFGAAASAAAPSAFTPSSSSSSRHRRMPPSAPRSRHRHHGNAFNDRSSASRSRSPSVAGHTDSDSDETESSSYVVARKRGRTRKRRQSDARNDIRLSNRSRISASFSVNAPPPMPSPSHADAHVRAQGRSHTSASTPISSASDMNAPHDHVNTSSRTPGSRRCTSTSLPPAKKRARSNTEPDASHPRARTSVDTNIDTPVQRATSTATDIDEPTSSASGSVPKLPNPTHHRVVSAFSSMVEVQRRHQNLHSVGYTQPSLPAQSTSAPATLIAKRNRPDNTESPAIIPRKRAKTFTTTSPSSPPVATHAEGAVRDVKSELDAHLLVALKSSGTRVGRGTGVQLGRHPGKSPDAPRGAATYGESAPADAHVSGAHMRANTVYSASVSGKDTDNLKIHVRRTQVAPARGSLSASSVSNPGA